MFWYLGQVSDGDLFTSSECGLKLFGCFRFQGDRDHLAELNVIDAQQKLCWSRRKLTKNLQVWPRDWVFLSRRTYTRFCTGMSIDICPVMQNFTNEPALLDSDSTSCSKVTSPIFREGSIWFSFER